LKQEAELRIVLRRGDSNALMVRASIVDDELYCGMHEKTNEEVLRTSYHGTGQTHTYVADGAKRVEDTATVPLLEFQGKERIWGIAPDTDALEWTYTLSPDSAIRRNLLLDLGEVPEMWSVDIWMIEHGRTDLVEETLAFYGRGDRIISYRHIDWTQPQLLAVAWAPSDEVVDSLRRYAEESLPPGGKFMGFVSGPGPPSGPPVTVYEWEQDEKVTKSAGKGDRRVARPTTVYLDKERHLTPPVHATEIPFTLLSF
jgi:hypothetical protein